MLEQQSIPEWILEENEKLDKENCIEGEKLPSLHFEENKLIEFEVDFTNKFREWENKEFKITNAIIPVTHEKEKKQLWLNKRNPLYRQIINAGKSGINVFKVIQTGTKASTKYSIVKS